MQTQEKPFIIVTHQVLKDLLKRLIEDYGVGIREATDLFASVAQLIDNTESRNKELEARNAELERMTSILKEESKLNDVYFNGPDEDGERIAELEAELAALRETHNDVLTANHALWQDVERLKAELAKHTTANVQAPKEAPEKVDLMLGYGIFDFGKYPHRWVPTETEAIEIYEKEGLGYWRCGDIRTRIPFAAHDFEHLRERYYKAKEAPEKHPFDSGLVAVRYEEPRREIAAWTSTEHYREFVSRFQKAGYLVKPASEVDIHDVMKDHFVKNAWKP